MSLTIRDSEKRGAMAVLSGGVIVSLLALTAATVHADPQATPETKVEKKAEQADSSKKSEAEKEAEAAQKETDREVRKSENQAEKAQNKADREEKRDQKQAAKNRFEEGLATALILANENEIKACQIAQQKSSSPEVKKFAQMMEQQHQEFLAKLQPFGETKQADRRSERQERVAAFRFNPEKEKEKAEKQAEKRAEKIQQAGAEEVATADESKDAHRDSPEGKDGVKGLEGTYYHRMSSLQEELAQQCRSTMEKELNAKSGQEFDECFVGMQIGAHMHMVDTLTVFERHVSGDLKEIVSSGLQTSQSHLDHAKSLMKTLESGANRTANASATEAK